MAQTSWWPRCSRIPTPPLVQRMWLDNNPIQAAPHRLQHQECARWQGKRQSDSSSWREEVRRNSSNCAHGPVAGQVLGCSAPAPILRRQQRVKAHFLRVARQDRACSRGNHSLLILNACHPAVVLYISEPDVLRAARTGKLNRPLNTWFRDVERVLRIRSSYPPAVPDSCTMHCALQKHV